MCARPRAWPGRHRELYRLSLTGLGLAGRCLRVLARGLVATVSLLALPTRARVEPQQGLCPQQRGWSLLCAASATRCGLRRCDTRRTANPGSANPGSPGIMCLIGHQAHGHQSGGSLCDPSSPPMALCHSHHTIRVGTTSVGVVYLWHRRSMPSGRAVGERHRAESCLCPWGASPTTRCVQRP